MKLSNCRNTLYVAIHGMSFPSWNSSLFNSCMITEFCVTSSLAVDNWGQKDCSTRHKPNPSIPIIFDRFSFKFLKIVRLLGKIKRLRFKSLSFFLEIYPYAALTYSSQLSFLHGFYLVRVVIHVAWLACGCTYCVPLATLNQNKRSRFLYLGDAQIIMCFRCVSTVCMLPFNFIYWI